MRPNPEPNHLFTPYVITKTNETVYFALLNVPAKLYTSEEIIAVTTRCYNGLLLPMSFKQLDHDFHSASYLIQSNKNVLGLHRLLSIKKDCG